MDRRRFIGSILAGTAGALVAPEGLLVPRGRSMVVVPAVWKTPFGTVHVMLNGADTGVRVSKALIEDLGPVDFVNVFRSYLSEEIGARLDEAFLGTAVRDEVRGVLGP